MKPIDQLVPLAFRPSGPVDDQTAAAATAAAIERAARFQREIAERARRAGGERAATPGLWLGAECGVPPRICADLDPNFGPAAHPVAVTWTGTPWLLAVIGSRGAGKTYLGAAVLARLASANPPEYRGTWKGLWVDCVEALDQVRLEIGTPDDGKTIAALMRANALVLDDVGSDRIARDSSPFRAERLALILRHRYNHLLPTVITANVASLSDITPGDARVADRLQDCELIHLDGDSMRPQRGDR